MATLYSTDEPFESTVAVDFGPNARELVGSLRYDPDEGVSLNLIDRGEAERVLLGSRTHYPMLTGWISNGQPITLVEGFIDKTTLGLAGIADVRIRANKLLIGIHLSDPEATPFDGLQVSFTDLNEWFGGEFITSSLYNGSPLAGRKNVKIECVLLDRFAFSPVSGGPTLGSYQFVRTNGDQACSMTIQNECLLWIRNRSAMGLDECIAELFRLQAFMSILSGRQLFCRRVQLLLHGVEERDRLQRAVALLPRFARGDESRKRAAASRLLLPVARLHDSLPSLWSAWTMRYTAYRTPVELFVSTQLFQGQLSAFQYVSIMQALETLHRNRFGGAYVAEAEYSSVADIVSRAIPAKVNADLRAALKARLKYGNEFSLRKRLRQLAEGLPGGASGQTASLIHPELADFLSLAVETRNYLTHYTPELQSSAFRDGDLQCATRLLRWFFVAVLLNDMGLPEGTLIEAMSGSFDLASVRSSFAKVSRAD